MTLSEAILARHSVRAYTDRSIEGAVLTTLQQKIEEVNAAGGLHVQLILDEPKAFLGPMSKYGRFRGVKNYLVMAGKKGDDLDERVGYYGEQQKFHFEYLPTDDGKAKVAASKGVSLLGYTLMDLGIAKYHFEIGAGKDNFDWE